MAGVLRAALIGAGHIAQQHLSCLQALPAVEVAAVCDLSAAVAESAAERHRVAAWFTDYRQMLREIRPDVVHVTTPPPSHFALASDSLAAGAHVVVEKPATQTFDELERLVSRAAEADRALVENYNYLFNPAPLEILRLIEWGDFGAVVHVEVIICLDILGPSDFADLNTPHPCLTLKGGAIADFLPHLASIAHLFVGPHLRAHGVWTKRKASILPYDEFRGLVVADRGTAALAFSASAQPDAFWLRVYGERMRATANLFERRLTFERVRSGPKPLQPVLNAFDEARGVRLSALGSLWGKFRGGPGAYAGLHELVSRVYRALSDGGTFPVSPQQILEVNRMVEALKPTGKDS
jgi:predicted dehydrogenase